MTAPSDSNKIDPILEIKRPGRRLSLTFAGGTDIQNHAAQIEANSGEPASLKANTNSSRRRTSVHSERRGSVRRRSIVELADGGKRVEERKVSKRFVKMQGETTTDKQRAIQTPLGECVGLLGSIMLMDDLPVALTTKISRVLHILGSPELLFQSNLGTKDGLALAGMDEDTKEWFEDVLRGAPEITDDDSEKGSERRESVNENGEAGPGRNNAEGGNGASDGCGGSNGGEDGKGFAVDRNLSSLGQREKTSFIDVTSRKVAMKKTMSDVTPSDIAMEDDYTSDSDSTSADEKGPGDINLQQDTEAKTRWMLIKSTMTPLMRWIAHSKSKQRKGLGPVNEDALKRKKSHSESELRGEGDDESGSTEDLAPSPSGRQVKKRNTVRTRRVSHPKCLEVALPVVRGMKDETVEPIQEFFEQNHFDAWEFDVFQLDKITKSHSLWFLGMILFEHYKIIDIFQINNSKLSNFLLKMEGTYVYDEKTVNPYHNHVHAADVLQTTAHFATTGPVQKRLRVIHGFALFVAAMGHDYRHPGVTNAFLINSQDEIAITYNDMSVLENFHAAELFKVLLAPSTHILSGMDPRELRSFRNMCVKTILATDLAQGFEYVSKFKGKVQTGHAFDSEDGKLLLMQMVMKVADVSHPCKMWNIHVQWSNLISNEFFLQGDRERDSGLPVSPLCNKDKHFLPKSQCDFVDFVVRPSVEVFSDYCKSDLWLSMMNKNYLRWKTMYEEIKRGDVSSPQLSEQKKTVNKPNDGEEKNSAAVKINIAKNQVAPAI